MTFLKVTDQNLLLNHEQWHNITTFSVNYVDLIGIRGKWFSSIAFCGEVTKLTEHL